MISEAFWYIVSLLESKWPEKAFQKVETFTGATLKNNTKGKREWRESTRNRKLVR